MMTVKSWFQNLIILILVSGSSSTKASSTWTFGSASARMSWTPLADADISAVSEREVSDSYDLLVVVVPHNATTYDEDEVSGHGEIIQNMLETKTKSVVRVVDDNSTTKRISIIELPPEEDDEGALGRKVSTSLISTIATEKGITTCGVLLPAEGPCNSTTFLSECSSSILVGLYKDKRFKSKEDDASGSKSVAKIDFIVSSSLRPSDAEAALHRGKVLAKGVYLAKDVVNAPHNSLNSLGLADTAKAIASKSGGTLSCRILEADDCEKRGMGAFLGVARGSETSPKFIHLTYKPRSRRSRKNPPKKLGIVGKGLLFDTGGYNIKTAMMELMKFDCGGAAAVLGAARAISVLQPPGVEVHFVIAACENMINERAVVPGDILTASNGKTIEVINTDAEGRLTMADALVFVDKEVDCDKIIELSTLTGSCIGALGNAMSGVWTENTDLLHGLQMASKTSGEKLWNMPLEKEYNEQLKSKIADLRNIGGRYGGAITAALFLCNFVDTKPFAHIDMAGPVWSTKIGATGWGVKLVTEWVCQHCQQ